MAPEASINQRSIDFLANEIDSYNKTLDNKTLENKSITSKVPGSRSSRKTSMSRAAASPLRTGANLQLAMELKTDSAK